MGNKNRREFFEELIATQVENAPAKTAHDTVFEKYANQTLPSGLKGTSGLSPYSGTWGRNEIIHLLRRTTFGVREADIAVLQSKTVSDAVDYLINNIPAGPVAAPVNNYENAYPDPTGVGLGQPWVNAAYGDSTVNNYRIRSFKSWWVARMVNQDLNILEKMVMFWHNYFATETNSIGDARLIYKHHDLLRTMALGNFKTLTRQITTDPGMLKYLNGYLNTKTAPDENYGRELQELFTIGKENPLTYIEDDVKAAARVLTGWRINTTTISSYFDSTKHDTGNKFFSAYYGNMTITGKTGVAGATETDELIDMLFSKMETALHMCRRLYRFFVYYVIDQATEISVIAPLAQTLVYNSFDIKPVLAQLLKSDHFYDMNSQGCYIRTPADFIAGTFRSAGITVPTSISIDKQYALWNYLRNYLVLLEQDPGDPPNVAGWPAFHQEPQYYETWINSVTLPKRMEFSDMMLASGFSAGTGTAMKIDVLAFAKQCIDPSNPNTLIDFFADVLLGLDISAAKKTSLKIANLLSGQTNDTYWTTAWINYQSLPNSTNTNTVKTRITGLLTELVHLAEHQLC